jgi:hypothetical protein
MRKTKKPPSERRKPERPEKLSYSYGAYDTPEVFERMFPASKDAHIDGDAMPSAKPHSR